MLQRFVLILLMILSWWYRGLHTFFFCFFHGVNRGLQTVRSYVPPADVNDRIKRITMEVCGNIENWSSYEFENNYIKFKVLFPFQYISVLIRNSLDDLICETFINLSFDKLEIQDFTFQLEEHFCAFVETNKIKQRPALHNRQAWIFP